MNHLVECDLNVLLAVQLCLQIAVLFLLAWLGHGLFRRRPKLQHFSWLVALLVVMILAPLKLILPAWSVELTEPRLGVVAQAPSSADQPFGTKGLGFSHSSVVSSEETHAWRAPSELGPANLETNLTGDSTPQISSLLAAKNGTGMPTFSLFGVLLILYLSIVAILLLRLLLGMRALTRICRGAQRPAQESFAELLLNELELKRKPQVLLSDEVSIPMAFGILRPTILLPNEFDSWGSDLQRMVLIHEAGHIKRCDAVWDLLSRFTSSIYWFHPFVHLLSWFLRRTRENATDALVLEHGVSPTRYAKQLLAISPREKTQRHPALFMARHGEIRNRIESILAFQPEQNGSNPQSIFRKACISIAMVSVACFSLQFSYAKAVGSIQAKSPLQDISSAAKDAVIEKPKLNVTGKTFYERIQQMKPRERWRVLPKKFTLTGRVENENGKPVSGADVVLRDSATMFTIGEQGAINDVVAKTKSSEEGMFEFADIPNPNLPHEGYRPYEVFVVSKDRVGYESLGPMNATDEGTIALVEPIRIGPSVEITGKVVSPAGKPLKGVDIRISHFKGALGGSKFSHFSDRMMSPRTATDEAGNFSIEGLPDGVFVGLRIMHPDFATNFQTIWTKEDLVNLSPEIHKRPRLGNGSTIVMEEGVKLSGVILDHESKPRSGINVSTFFRRWKTNKDGKFEIRVSESQIVKDRLELWISNQESVPSSKYKYHSSHYSKVSELKEGTAQLVCPIPATLRGRVVTEVGRKPIPSVVVTLDSEDGTDNIAVTDRNGEFVREIDSGRIRVGVDGENPGLKFGSGKAVPYDLKPGENRSIEISVAAMMQAKVQVVDPDGTPAMGAEVGFCRDGEFQTVLKSNQNGRASFDSFSEERWSDRLFARMQKDGKTFWAEADIRDESKDHKLRLAPAIELSGKISAKGKPLSRVTVRVLKDGESRSRPLLVAVTDADGNYAMNVPSKNYDGSTAHYRISLEPCDAIPNEQVNSVVQRATSSGKELNADLDLVTGSGTIAGQVLDVKGNPVANVDVKLQSLYLKPVGSANDEIQASELFESSSCISGPDGVFEIEGLPKGYLALVSAQVPGKLVQGVSMVKVGDRDAKLLVMEAVDQPAVDTY